MGEEAAKATHTTVLASVMSCGQVAMEADWWTGEGSLPVLPNSQSSQQAILGKLEHHPPVRTIS